MTGRRQGQGSAMDPLGPEAPNPVYLRIGFEGLCPSWGPGATPLASADRFEPSQVTR